MAAPEHSEVSRKRKADAAFARKENNRAVITDTMKQCRVSGPARRSHFCVLPGGQPRETVVEGDQAAARIHPHVHEGDCVALAQELSKQPGAKVWMLNMACAGKPGGGALSGSNAQEEHVCRCSDLLPQLYRAAAEHLYPLIKRKDLAKSDFKVLVHKEVVFFKRPCDYATLPEREWFRIGVLTAAAENVTHTGYNVGPNAQRYIDFLLDVVDMQGAQCSHIILSAWGCGAFHQNAHAVASCFRKGLARFDPRAFPEVTFALIDDHNSPPPGNLHAFRTVFGAGA